MIKKQSIKFGRSLRDLYKYQTLSVANTPFLTLSETNYFLKSRLESGTPFTAFKIGKNERDWLRLLLFQNSLKATLTRQKIRSWDSRLRGKNPAGLFPFNYAEVLNFSQLYYNCIKSADLICKFHSQKDNFLAEHIGNKAVVYSDSLNVFNLFLLLQSGIKKSDLWFNSLYGRILIVNPFENSIQNSIDVHSDI